MYDVSANAHYHIVRVCVVRERSMGIQNNFSDNYVAKVVPLFGLKNKNPFILIPVRHGKKMLHDPVV